MPGNRTTNSTETGSTTGKDFSATTPPVITAALTAATPVIAGEELTRGRDSNIFNTGNKPTKKRNNYLLLIGIDYYENGLSKLNNPVRDANALLEVLKERYAFFPEDENAFELLKEQEAKSGKNR